VIDLHTHSTFSDGSDRPAELARRAHEIGLRAIALTDHDTTASHDEMAEACADLHLEYVTGVEVSLRDNAFPQVHRDSGLGPRNVHVLAYFVPLDPEHPLQRALASLRHDRDVRNEALVALLVDQGFNRLTLDYLADIAGNVHSIGRPHFARAMFELHPEIVGPRHDETWSRVFTEWLGATGRAYVPKTSMPVEEFVAAARGSGAVLSIAHPLDNYLDGASNAALETTMAPVLASLRERGFVGVEAYYGSWSAATRARMVKVTRDAGMIPTGGSDYHGHYKENVRLGVGLTGDLRVPDEVLDELRAAHER
jgi:predicted metal-dependent phosphoesterase TrpH